MTQAKVKSLGGILALQQAAEVGEDEYAEGADHTEDALGVDEVDPLHEVV